MRRACAWPDCPPCWTDRSDSGPLPLPPSLRPARQPQLEADGGEDRDERDDVLPLRFRDLQAHIIPRGNGRLAALVPLRAVPRPERHREELADGKREVGLAGRL